MRGPDILAIVLAMLGATLAVQAWSAGSVFRYQLAGIVLGVALSLPLVAIVVLRRRGRLYWRRALFAAVPLLAVLLVLEFAMRLVGPAPVAPEQLVEHDELGHALAPGSGGTDEWGFRNERVPERVDALFVGDSQTWGFFLDREQAFPALFAHETGASAYQMAMGGYGAVRYRELVRRGLTLAPSFVVVGFYFGNDLWDARDGAGLAVAEDLRAPDRSYARPRSPDLAGPSAPNWTMAIVDGLQQHSRLCGFCGRVLKAQLSGASAVLDAQPGAVPFAGKVPTMLLPDYRQPALDLEIEAIADGLRITELCLADIARQCAAVDARCVLLAIPTKEYCYAEWQRRAGTPIDGMRGLHSAETAVRQHLFAAAERANIELVDLAPICIDALAAGTAIWARSGDGHLMVDGHVAAARAIAQVWRGR